MLPAEDAELIQIVDAELLDAVRRAGSWLACRPGCNQCCTGVFRISQLDAERLKCGLEVLAATRPERALQTLERINTSRHRLSATFPGDPTRGVLSDDEEAASAFEDFGNDEVCPILDPLDGTCTLYAHRPMTCRTFGPPVVTEGGGLGMCELCFVGASQEIIKAAELRLPAPHKEATVAAQVTPAFETVIAFAFRHDEVRSVQS